MAQTANSCAFCLLSGFRTPAFWQPLMCAPPPTARQRDRRPGRPALPRGPGPGPSGGRRRRRRRARRTTPGQGASGRAGERVRERERVFFLPQPLPHPLRDELPHHTQPEEVPPRGGGGWRHNRSKRRKREGARPLVCPRQSQGSASHRMGFHSLPGVGVGGDAPAPATRRPSLALGPSGPEPGRRPRVTASGLPPGPPAFLAQLPPFGPLRCSGTATGEAIQSLGLCCCWLQWTADWKGSLAGGEQLNFLTAGARFSQ